MEISEKYLLSLQQLSLNEIMKLLLNFEGVKKADRGDFDAALECFSQAIKLPPKDSVSYFNRASLKMCIGDFNGARLDLKELETNGLKKNLSRLYQIILSLLIIMLFL